MTDEQAESDTVNRMNEARRCPQCGGAIGILTLSGPLIIGCRDCYYTGGLFRNGQPTPIPSR